MASQAKLLVPLPAGMQIPQSSRLFDRNGGPLYPQHVFASIQGPAENLITGMPPDAQAVRHLILAGSSVQELKPAPVRSKYRGLTWDKKERRWRVRINVLGKQHHVGRWAWFTLTLDLSSSSSSMIMP